MHYSLYSKLFCKKRAVINKNSKTFEPTVELAWERGARVYTHQTSIFHRLVTWMLVFILYASSGFTKGHWIYLLKCFHVIVCIYIHIHIRSYIPGLKVRFILSQQRQREHTIYSPQYINLLVDFLIIQIWVSFDFDAYFISCFASVKNSYHFCVFN